MQQQLRSVRGRLVALALLGQLGGSVGLIGCTDDDPPPASIPCDIRVQACRSAIFALTAEVRAQDNAQLPPTRIITRAQFADETRAAATQSMSTREGQVLEATFRLLRFLPAQASLSEAMADSSIAGVAAYYDPNTRSVTIIDDAAEDAYSGSLTLSHEYTHALQDQREVIATVAQNASSTDEVMAVNALIEGEATILSDVTLARALGMPYLRDDVLAFMARLLRSLLLTIERSDAPFNQGLLVLPYPVGGLPVAEAYLDAGIAGVQSFYTQRPSSLIGWAELDQPETLPQPLRCDAPDAPRGYERIHFDRLGGTGLIALYTRLGLSGSDAFTAARAWTHDGFSVFAPVVAPDGSAELSAAYAWRIGLRDEAAATQLETLLVSHGAGISGMRQGNELILTGADKLDVLSGWSVRNDCSTAKSRSEARALLPAMPRY